MRKTLLLIGVLAALLVGTTGPVAHAQTGLTFQVRAGFDGLCKLNGWVPVYVVVENSGPDINGEIQVKMTSSFSNGVAYTQPAILPTQSRKQFTLYVYVQNYTRELVVELVQKGQVIAEQKAKIEPLDEQQFLIGVLGDDPAALNYLAGLPPVNKGRFYVAHLTLNDLPAQGGALGGLDALIVHNLDTASLTSAQRDALRSWIAWGGQLIVLGGPGAVPTAAGLGDLLPVRIIGSQTTDDLHALGDFAGTPLEARQATVVAQVEPVEAEILAGDPALPLLVRRSFDRGRIDYLALDADLEPLRTWGGKENLWKNLLFATPLRQRSGVLGYYGYYNVPLANIPNLNIPSVLLVMAFLFAYILIVGPLNLLVLKLVDKQSLAWITVPVLIILFSCTAYVFGVFSRGQKVIVSQITLLRTQPSSQVAWVDNFVGIYSPLRRQYDVRLPDRYLVMQLENQPYGSSTGISPAMLWVEQGPPTYVRDLNINVGAMRGFSAHSLEQWAGVEANLTISELKSGVYHVEGTITNRSNARITNSILVFHQTYQPLGDLAVGESKSISLDFDSTKTINYYMIAEHLAGPMGFGKAERVRQRKLDVANMAIQPYYYRSTRPQFIDGLSLIGWLDASPVRVTVEDANSELVETVLLIASLPVSASQSGQFLVPPGMMRWQVIDGDPSSSPYEIYNYQPVTTFKFFIPDSRNIVIEKLTLYVQPTDNNPTPIGQPPVIYVRDVKADKWEAFNALTWGGNDLPDPQRFVGTDGGVEVRVSTTTIQFPVSVALAVSGSR